MDEWLEKAEFVCRIYKIKRLECILLLHLSSRSFTVYQWLSLEEKSAQIKQALQISFATDKFMSNFWIVICALENLLIYIL